MVKYSVYLGQLQHYLETMKVIIVPVLDDNFAYLLVDESGVTAAVDPAQPEKV